MYSNYVGFLHDNDTVDPVGQTLGNVNPTINTINIINIINPTWRFRFPSQFQTKYFGTNPPEGHYVDAWKVQIFSKQCAKVPIIIDTSKFLLVVRCFFVLICKITTKNNSHWYFQQGGENQNTSDMNLSAIHTWSTILYLLPGTLKNRCTVVQHFCLCVLYR